MNNRIHSPTNCISNEYTIINSLFSLLQKHPYIKLQYIKQSDPNQLILLERSTTLSKQAQQLPPSDFQIADTINLSAELILNNRKVSSDLTLNIRTAFASTKLWEYYQDKFSWTLECIQSIDWISHGNALNTLRQRHKKTIIQFNHRWLPIYTSHSLQYTGTARLCPICTQIDETHHHYLSCSHPTSKQIWSSNIQLLQEKNQKYNKHINKTIIKLNILAITEWRLTPHPPQPSFITQPFFELFQQQSIIGWDQIIHGRFSSSWNSLQRSFSQKAPTTWLTYMIRTIWYHSYEIWKHRCNVNIGITPQDKRQRELLRLTPKIRSLYNKINQIAQSDVETIFNYKYEEIILLPTSTIEKWIYKADIRIAASIKRQKQQDKTTNHPIKKFFHRLIPTTIPTKSEPNHETSPPKAKKTIKKFISNTITTFFPIRYQYNDPHIPIPTSDYRPP
jgi:hypothetical protein